MSITRLELKNFTVFADAKFEFCPGINVLIGENASGKTHVLKLLYASRTTLENASPQPLAQANTFVSHTLSSFFGNHPATLHALFSLGDDLETIHLEIHHSDAQAQLFRFTVANVSAKASPTERSEQLKSANVRSSIFLPPRDVLAMYPGFTAAYEHRELSFDKTFYDLCLKLSAARLRGKATKTIADLITPIENVLGGTIMLRHDGFHVYGPRGEIPAPFLAEGWRKLATLAYLIANGSLTTKSILFIDEPEASLNPTLIIKMVEILRQLAHAGVQIFLASHDYLLVHRLSQAAEHGLQPAVPLRFFALHRPEPGAPVQVETADTLAQIEHNAILREFARYYDDEQRLTLDDLTKPATKPSAPKKTSKKSAKKATKKSPKKTAKKTTRR